MCCGEFVAKYVLFFFNLACTLVGLVFIVLGVVVVTNITELDDVVSANLSLIPIAVIIFGSIIFVISFFGCCGAVKENGCMLIFYSVIMIILAGLKTWLAVVLFRNLSSLQNTVEDWLTKAFADSDLRLPYNIMELSFKCCGTTGADSYLNSATPILPGSCCGLEVTQACEATNAFEGCTTVVRDYLQTYGDAIGGIVITIIIVEVIAIILALFLNHSVSQRKR